MQRLNINKNFLFPTGKTFQVALGCLIKAAGALKEHLMTNLTYAICMEIEFQSKKLLKLKYRREDEIIQTFCKIGSPQKLGAPPSLICRNFKTLRKVFLIHAKSTEILLMTQNLGP